MSAAAESVTVEDLCLLRRRLIQANDRLAQDTDYVRTVRRRRMARDAAQLDYADALALADETIRQAHRDEFPRVAR